MSTPPYVIFRLADGSTTTLFPGEIIGRGVSASLLLDDHQISEAHALVSLRGASLQLLKLRGMLKLAGEDHFLGEITLEVGQHIVVSSQISLEVFKVSTPDEILVLEGLTRAPIPLTQSEYEIGGHPLSIHPREEDEVYASIWQSGETWMRRVSKEEKVAVIAGEEWMVNGSPLCIKLATVDDASFENTESPLKIVEPPPSLAQVVLELSAERAVIRYPEDDEFYAITGHSARILYITANATKKGIHMRWKDICDEIWYKYKRNNWDSAKNYLRKKLREAGIRDTFFVYKGGQVWLDIRSDREEVILT